MSVNMHRWPEHHHLYHYQYPHPHQWNMCHPAQMHYVQHHYSPPSNNRQMRNAAEKTRRDKLNYFIGELSTLVPYISYSPKKMDKTSVLRLTGNFIRLNNVINGPVRPDQDLGPPPDSIAALAADIQNQMIECLPQYVVAYNWSEDVLQELGGVIMILSGSGCIVFISDAVEQLLGHTSLELMGQDLFKITYLEDFEELKRNLNPEYHGGANGASSANSEAGGDESSSDSGCNGPRRILSASRQIGADRRLRRSFYIRLQQRPQSRSDQPHYELVHIMGYLRMLPKAYRRSENPPNNNDVILVAVAKPFREKRITTLSLMEACREEFITRHTLDGRIIYTDHRISIVAGYLSEEVCGVPGFQYMHKEDMRWTMVGLRQMFFRGSSYGQSCYRLQTKSGTFIYLKTCGYLELSENNDSFQSLICINSLVSAAEGEALIRQMKEQYSPIIKNKNDKNMEILTSNIHTPGSMETTGETEDPKVLEVAINQMIANVPSPAPQYLHSPPPSNIDPTDPQIAKVTLAAKAVPPLHVHTKKIGIVPPMIRTPAAVAASLSPPSSLHSPPPALSPPTPPAKPPPALPLQNRPSVLRVARQGDQVSVVNVKRLRTDEGMSDVQSEPSPVALVPEALPHRSVLVAPGSKRKCEDVWQAAAPAQVLLQPSLQPLPPPLSPPHFPLEVNEILNDTDFDPLPDFNVSPPPSLSNNIEDMELLGMTLWPQPETLDSTHQALDSRLQLQDSQIQDIQQDLTLVPPDHSDTSHYNSRLSQLQVEHRRQQELLKTLQHDLQHDFDNQNDFDHQNGSADR